MSTATVMRAYRFALDPAPGRARDLERHAGAARFAFNWALAAVRVNIGQRAAERSYGLDGDELTGEPGVEPARVAASLQTRPRARSPRGGPSVPRRRSTPVWMGLPGR